MGIWRRRGRRCRGLEVGGGGCEAGVLENRTIMSNERKPFG